MSKPLVTLENYENVYNYYQEHIQNPTAAWASHTLLAAAIRPHVGTVHPDIPAQLDSFHDAGYQFVIAANHLSDIDPPVIASLTRHFAPFRLLEGNTFIPSKSSLFHNPLLRRIIDGLGATPQFRTSDVGRDGQPLPDKVRELRNAARDRSFEMARHKLQVQGQNMAIFPEKTRNTVDPSRLQKLGFGLGEILCNLNPELKLVIVPVGVYYGSPELNAMYQSGREDPAAHTSKPARTIGMIKRLNAQRKPFTVIGQPVAGPFISKDDFYPTLHQNMQESIDLAQAAYEQSQAA